MNAPNHLNKGSVKQGSSMMEWRADDWSGNTPPGAGTSNDVVDIICPMLSYPINTPPGAGITPALYVASLLLYSNALNV